MRGTTIIKGETWQRRYAVGPQGLNTLFILCHNMSEWGALEEEIQGEKLELAIGQKEPRCWWHNSPDCSRSSEMHIQRIAVVALVARLAVGNRLGLSMTAHHCRQVQIDEIGTELTRRIVARLGRLL
jgi:hypothetical protein